MIFNCLRKFQIRHGTLSRNQTSQLFGTRMVADRNGVHVNFGTVVEHIWGTFDLVVFKETFASFGVPNYDFPKYDFQNTTSTNRIQNLPNSSRIIVSLFLTNPRLQFLK